MSTSRRETLSRRQVAGLMVGAGAAVASGVRVAHAAQTTIRFSYQRSSTLLSLLKAAGTLEARLGAQGYTVSWHLFDDVIPPMNTGAVDFHADVADAVPIFTQSAGAPLTLYAREEGSPLAEAIIVKAGSAVRAVADLKGRKVAVGRGSGCHFVLAAALKRAGLSFRDITVAYLKPADAAIAFERGDVEAWVIWDPYLAIAQDHTATRILCDATGLSSYQRFYAVNTTFVEQHPDIVGLVFAALAETGTWVKQHPQEAMQRLTPLWSGVPATVIETVNAHRSYAVRSVNRQALGEQQAIADTFLEAGLIPKRIDATAVALWQPKETRT